MEGGRLPGTSAERKRLKDLQRKRGGRRQRKRLHVLQNPLKLAFRGWEDVAEPWQLSMCEEFIEWCHIDRHFPLERHHHHRYSDKANLTYCLNGAFIERCIEVYQWLYNTPKVHRNEAPLFMCRMVYAEVILGKAVDWRTIKNAPKLTVPEVQEIPRGKKFPEGGLGRVQTKFHNVVVVHETDESEYDPDSDGTRGERVPRARVARAARVVQNRVAPAEAAVEDIAGASNNAPLATEFHGFANLAAVENMVEGVLVFVGGDQPCETEELQRQLAEKDRVIAELQETIRSLRVETTSKDLRISSLRSQLQHQQTVRVVEGNQTAVAPQPMEVDDVELNRVIELETARVLEDISTPAKRRRLPVFLPPMGPQAQPYVDIDGPLSQDSLSFGTSANVAEVNALRAANDELRLRISTLSKQYYQWKVATILTVDRGAQMAKEFQKIDNNYIENNTRRDFGLTSWAHSDEMYPSDLPTLPENSDAIDWAKLDFDHANAMSCHGLRIENQVPSRKLWPLPAPWVVDGSTCNVCYNPFGPEGAWALGTCQHMFHPMCLITHALVRRFCPVCHSPVHKRWYEVFGLTKYMPPSHERNPENTPGHGYNRQWGEDLIWSWRANRHSVFTNNISADLGWEENHEEIVRVCHKIIGSAPADQGKRNFFYQTMDGFWNAEESKFQFGEHPNKLRWNRDGRLVSARGMEAPLDIQNAVQMDLSEWKEIWKSEAIDFLLEEHSPRTLRTLEELRNSQMLRNLTEADGPHRRTRARRPIFGSDEVGPSNTASIVDLDEE